MSDLGLDLSALLAANDYGSGPGYLDADKNPYQRADQRLGFTTDILRAAGIYLDDILGIPDAPEMPDPSTMPVRSMSGYQSDLRGAYAGNPVLSAAFQDIEGGADPLRVAQRLELEARTNPEVAASLPAFQEEGVPGAPNGPTNRTSLSGVQELLTQFAEDVARERRESGLADQEYNQALDMYTQQVDAYNNYFQPSDELRDSGFQSEDDYIDQYMQANRRNTGLKTGYSRRPEVVEDDWQFPDMPEGLQGQRVPFPGMPTGLQGNPSPTERNVGRRPAPVPSRELKTVSKRNASDEFVNNRIQQIAGRNASDMARNTRASQAETDNRRRLAAAYSLIFGEAA